MPTMRRIPDMAVPTTRTKGQDPTTYNMREHDMPKEEEVVERVIPEIAVNLPVLKVAEQNDWKTLGECVTSDVDFFPDTLTPKAERACKAVCSRCTVRSECLEFAVANNVDFFVYGGLTAKERKAL